MNHQALLLFDCAKKKKAAGRQPLTVDDFFVYDFALGR